jgi:hypothetical protein
MNFAKKDALTGAWDDVTPRKIHAFQGPKTTPRIAFLQGPKSAF